MLVRSVRLGEELYARIVRWASGREPRTTTQAAIQYLLARAITEVEREDEEREDERAKEKRD